MSHINRTEGIFRGLRIHNKDNNVLEMNQNGNYRLSGRNITNYSYNNISNESEKDIIYKSNNNLLLGSKNGRILIRNGNEFDQPLFNYENIYYEDNEEPLKLKSEDDINNIRNNSLLIETLDKNRNICLLSNKGIDQISHGNINLVGDSNINLQSHKNININSYENIILNSERIITTVEDDIMFLSSHGELKLGGDGINNIGLKVNSNYNKNYIGLGNLDDHAKRNLHINVKESLDNSNKNGILISGEEKNNIYPDICLKNNSNGETLTNLSIGLGGHFNDKIHFVKKINKNGQTYLISLDNYEFSLNDINNEIVYQDDNLKKDIIKSLTENKNTVLLNDTITDNQIEKFNYQKCIIKNNNNAYFKTITSSDLNIGVNNSNTINIKNNNNVGINNNNPTASLDISNKVGEITNIRLDKDKKYFKPKGIQMKNGNCILFCNTLKNDLYNLEAFIYSDNNFITSFTIYENSHSFIDYDIDNLSNKNDNFIIVYNFYNGLSYNTQIMVYNNTGNLIDEGYKFNHTYLEINSSPKIKSFCIESDNKIKKSGFLMVLRDMTIEGDIVCKIFVFEDNKYKDYNQIIDLYENVNSFIENNMDLSSNGKVISKINHKYINVNYNVNYKSFIVNISCDMVIKSNLNNSEDIVYFSILNEIFIDMDNFELTKIVELNLDNMIQYKLGQNKELNEKPINMSSYFEICECNSLLINSNSGLFKICYYIRNCKTNKIVNLISESYKSNNSNNEKFFNFKIIDNMEITNNNLAPSISHIKGNDFIISYQSENDTKYYLGSNDMITNLNLDKSECSYLIKLNDNYENYLSTLILYENKNSENLYFYESINFMEIESIGYIFKIKNKNNNITVKNNGNINLNDQIEINKEKEITKISNLVINKVDSFPSNPTVGQITLYRNELYIFINNNWKKIQIL